jgi:hypothetical protein
MFTRGLLINTFQLKIAMAFHVSLPKDVVRVQHAGRRVGSFSTCYARQAEAAAEIGREKRLHLLNARKTQILLGGAVRKETVLEKDRIEYVQSFLRELARVENASLERLNDARVQDEINQAVADQKRETEKYLRSCLG